MKLAICLINHNQNLYIDNTIKLLDKQTKKPDTIFICSDDKPYNSNSLDIICINNKEKHGRCENRNSVIPYFLNSNCDGIIFIDGDSEPMDNQFIEDYEQSLSKYDLIFGMRRHKYPKNIMFPASDLLTTNMDNMWQHNEFDFRDLRIVSGAVAAWQKSKTFTEKLDLMITGMIGWSCNFAFTKAGMIKHIDFMEKTYGRREIFDSAVFNKKWGYEDVAMGIDALYAGLNIGVSDTSYVLHAAHERSDGLFDHVTGRHLIMERMRALEKSVKVKPYTYTLMVIMYLVYIVGIITGLITGVTMID